MPSSHRADRRARGWGRLWIATVAVIAVIAAVLIGQQVLTRPTADRATSKITKPSPSSSPSPTPTPSPSSSPSATPKPSSSPTTGPRLPALSPTPPNRLTIAGLIDADFGNSLTAPTGGRLIPDSPGVLQRLATRGMPGSPGTDTVVLIGAATATCTGVLDDLSQVKVGRALQLQTDNADLTYTVRRRLLLDAGQVLGQALVRAKSPGRLVIDCAHYVDGSRVGKDLVLIAQLTGATRGG